MLRYNTIKFQDSAPLLYTVYIHTFNECSHGRVTCTGFPCSLRSLNKKRSWMCLHSWISLIWNKKNTHKFMLCSPCVLVNIYSTKFVKCESSFSTLSATTIMSTLNLVKCTCVGVCLSFCRNYRICWNSEKNCERFQSLNNHASYWNVLTHLTTTYPLTVCMNKSNTILFSKFEDNFLFQNHSLNGRLLSKFVKQI